MTGFFFIVATIALTTLIPWLVKRAIESLEYGRSDDVFLFCGLIAGIALLQGVTRVTSRTVVYSIGRRVEYDLRGEFFSHLQRLNPSYFDNLKTGDLISRATNDISAVRMLMGPGFLQVTNSCIVYLVIIPAMFFLDPILCFYALLPYPVIIVISRFLTRSMYKRSQEVQEQFGKISSKVQENLSGISVVKAFAMEGREEAVFDGLNSDYREKNIRFARLRAVMFTIMTALGSLTTLIILWKGGEGVVSGRIGLGDFVAFTAYAAILIWPTVGLGWIITVIQRGLSALDRVNTILDYSPTIVDVKSDGVEEAAFAGKIEFRGLTFAYKDPSRGTESQEILGGIDLTIAAGERFALVGPTGSGKSTLLNLIPRLYEVERGELFIDDKDICDIPLAVLRRQIGYVPQDSHLFSATIAENILFGGQGDSQAMEEAAHEASLYDDVLAFPDKFDTIVGEKGLTLSGGQRQRTALARALVGNPGILILDDSFSSLDTATEEKILSSLQGKFVEKKTCIIVSHRASTVMNCGRIAFIKEGKIVEVGTHSELLKKGGEYTSFFRRQEMEKELEELA
ncbi:MAG: ABC transporter ATP-binding protein [Proteobacteria bacterium]|nr:ABC transporter ATP-binding protein [Pseudomonadota bacterium]